MVANNQKENLTAIRTEWFIRLGSTNIPFRMLDSITNYVVSGTPPGGFLRSVLENNLHETVCRGDTENQQSLLNWIRVLEQLPEECWGSKAKVDQWLECKRKERDDTDQISKSV